MPDHFHALPPVDTCETSLLAARAAISWSEKKADQSTVLSGWAIWKLKFDACSSELDLSGTDSFFIT